VERPASHCDSHREGDRFLALASTTDNRTASAARWIIFGDPVLEMLPAEDSSDKQSHRNQTERRWPG